MWKQRPQQNECNKKDMWIFRRKLLERRKDQRNKIKSVAFVGGFTLCIIVKHKSREKAPLLKGAGTVR